MPFVSKEHRANPDATVPGDRCYMKYKQMISAWTASPRWTCVDQILEDFISDEDERAFFLAFLVFFSKHVMKYEDQKEAENGPI